jgi:hypothetical protein
MRMAFWVGGGDRHVAARPAALGTGVPTAPGTRGLGRGSREMQAAWRGGAGAMFYVQLACLAKRPAGPVAGAAWSCGGCLHTSCLGGFREPRAKRRCCPSKPPLWVLSRLPQSEDLESTDGLVRVRVHARRFAMGDLNTSKAQVIWVPNAISNSAGR